MMPHCGPVVDSSSNINEYQEYFVGIKGGRCVGLTTLPLSRTYCLAIWEPQPAGTARAYPDPYRIALLSPILHRTLGVIGIFH